MYITINISLKTSSYWATERVAAVASLSTAQTRVVLMLDAVQAAESTD